MQTLRVRHILASQRSANLPNRAVTVFQGIQQRLGAVAQQMPAIDNLLSLRGSLLGFMCIGSGTFSCDDLDPWMNSWSGAKE